MTLMTRLRKLLGSSEKEPRKQPEPTLEPWDEEREKRLTNWATALEEVANDIREHDDGPR
jgi:hypothetical protein